MPTTFGQDCSFNEMDEMKASFIETLFTESIVLVSASLSKVHSLAKIIILPGGELVD